MDDTSEHFRYPWRENGAGDAIDLHADDFAFDGQEAPNLNRSVRIPNPVSQRALVRPEAPQ
jgi:hypothetical protein